MSKLNYVLYGNGQSRSFRALWALEEAEAPYKYNNILFGSDEDGKGIQSDFYRVLNFQGKVPTLVEGDRRLTESGAILNHIGRRHPESGLVPTEGSLYRSRYDEICFFVLSDLEQPLWTNGKHRFVLPEELRVPDVIETTWWEFEKSLEALAHFLGDSDYAVADRFTMADILIAHTLTWAKNFEFKLPRYFEDYRSRMYARPECLRAMGRLE